MNIEIISIGKFRNNPQKEIFETYVKRTGWKIKLKELEAKNENELIQKEKEGELILAAINPSSRIILLDETGKNPSSQEFAKLIQNYQLNSESHLTFIIGGACGSSNTIKKKAHHTLSFGRTTFPHMMVRSILAEQLYRAYTILNNHPYHRE